MQLTHAADELPPERQARGTTTLVGAAHYWADRAKAAEAELAPLRRRVRALVVALIVVPVVAVAGSWLWILG